VIATAWPSTRSARAIAKPIPRAPPVTNETRFMHLYNSAVRSVVILGAGEVGGATARQVAAADVAARIVLVDEAEAIAQGKALDIRQAAPIDRYSTNITGTADESAVIDADVIVIADKMTVPVVEWQDDAGVGLVRRVAHLNPSGMILCAGAQQLNVVERAFRELGLPGQRVLGSAPEALRSAIISLTALEAGCTPAEVSLTVLGKPPHQIIVPWEDASIGGRRATDALSPPAITRLDARLSRLWPPGPLTLASAATRFLRAAAMRGGQTLSAFVVASRDEGDYGRAGMLPVTVTARGLARVIAPRLSVRDRVRLETALQR
jgi:malate dehydrogenase